MKYIGLSALTKILPTHPHVVGEHKDIILKCINDPNISIRTRAFDLIVWIDNKENWPEIVKRLITHPSNEGDQHSSINNNNGSATAALRDPTHRADIVPRITPIYSSDKRLTGLENPENANSTVLLAAAWLTGEYCRLVKSPENVLEHLSQMSTAKLDPAIWPTYLQSALKIFERPAEISECTCLNQHVRGKTRNFPAFFGEVLRLSLQGSGEVGLRMKRHLLVFMINCFQSLENALIRSECMRLVSLSTWHSLVPAEKRDAEFKEYPQLLKFWKHLEKKFDAMEEIAYCEQFLEFLIDLEAQLPTRRYFNTLVDDHQIVTICRLSNLASNKNTGTLFAQLLDILAFYIGFEINGHTGLALTKEEMTEIHASRLTKLQQIAFTHFRENLVELAMANLGSIEKRESLLQRFENLTQEELVQLCQLLYTRTSKLTDPPIQHSRHVLLELLLLRFEKRHSQIDRINALPLYPDENALFEDAAVKEEMYNADQPLTLPKLNLQFLTLHNYLLCNFNLSRLESNYEIRQDIEDAVMRLGPREVQEGVTVFSGWSRVAAPISHFKMVEVANPDLGEDVTFNVKKYTPAIQAEWEAIREHDILLLLTMEAHEEMDDEWDNNRVSFRKHYGLKYVHGCEVVSAIANGKFDYKKSDPQLIQDHRAGNTRTFRVALDPNQYKIDQENMRKKGGPDVYQTFNIVLRRKPQENNLKPGLETIRDLMQ
ncbi:hypothetical protein BGX31_002448, partial [Mortierella sp. GBA43]